MLYSITIQQGTPMKYINILILSTATLLFTACGDEAKESKSETIQKPNTTYLDSRVDAVEVAKKSVKESNERVQEQDKLMEDVRK
jgi:hypothetical protein